MAIPAESIFLDQSADGTLQSQIRQLIASGILAGRFRSGERLPSSRALAKHLGVSRITVTLAYTDLLADDYLTSQGRSGYYVSDSAPKPPRFERVERTDNVDWSRALGQRFSGTAMVDRPANWQNYTYNFIYGQTHAGLFDHANWRLCAVQALGTRDFASMTQDYYDQDDPKLLEFVARHTLPRRGIVAEPDEILITLGAQNALWLTAQVLLTQRRKAAIEDPGYPALRDILTQSRCHLETVPVDDQGLRPETLPDGLDVVFVTPSHHCPSTATMPLSRRNALLQRASNEDFLVVEDDYEAEMSFLKSPSPALKSLDRDGRVIYVGSFSKSLFPGLRLGYLVGARPFIKEARALRAAVLRHPPGHIQRTAAYFLSLGHYDALIRRTSAAFRDRRQIMQTAIDEHGLQIAVDGSHGGSSFWMRAPENINTTRLATNLRDQDVLIEPGHSFFADPLKGHRKYRLAYSSIDPKRIPEGIARIAQAIHG